MTGKNIKGEKINTMHEQASNKNERQRLLPKVISILGVSTGQVLLKNSFALGRCVSFVSLPMKLVMDFCFFSCSCLNQSKCIGIFIK